MINQLVGKTITTEKLYQNWKATIQEVIRVNSFGDGDVSIEFIDTNGDYRYWKNWYDGGTIK